MICHNKSNNVKYRRIKMNKLFGLDRKSRFKTNNYSFFYLLMLTSAKKHVKMSQKCLNMAAIRQYSTVFDII